MSPIVLVDPVAIVVDHLTAAPEVQALCDDRIYGRLPDGVTFPAVRVHRVDGRPIINRPRVAEAAVLQIDAFGATYDDEGARLLAETCAAVLADSLHWATGTGWTVTRLEFGGMSDQPDTTWTPARPRTLFEVTVFVRSRLGG